MSKLRVEPVARGGTRYTFWCPGCQDTHTFSCGVPDAPSWQFDGNLTAPTIHPSLMVKCGHYVDDHKPGDHCWCTFRDDHGKPAPFSCYRCHSYLKAGRLEFLGDCTHALAGQIVELPDLPEHLRK